MPSRMNCPRRTSHSSRTRERAIPDPTWLCALRLTPHSAAALLLFSNVQTLGRYIICSINPDQDPPLHLSRHKQSHSRYLLYRNFIAVPPTSKPITTATPRPSLPPFPDRRDLLPPLSTSDCGPCCTRFFGGGGTWPPPPRGLEAPSESPPLQKSEKVLRSQL
jgi:hypothetical protein